MSKGVVTILVFVFLISCKTDTGSQSSEVDNGGLVKVEPGVSSRFSFLLNYQPDSLCFPRSQETDGQVRCVPSSDWTSGFLPGTLVYLSELTGNDEFLLRAEEWLPYLEKEKNNARTHDMGFKINCSFGNAYRVTGKEEYKEVIVESANTLSTRYDSVVGCIKSWDFGKDQWQFPVIIDNMMNLELLFEATKITGDSSYHNIAVSHADNTLKNHYRSDKSSYHVIDYSTESGEVVQHLTHQGYDAESVWSRGQAWGLYGFTMAYRYTQSQAYLDHALKIAEFILNQENQPEDLIPYWDLKDPSIPNSPRDASAAAVIASALLELNSYEPVEQLSAAAFTIIQNLSSDNYALDVADNTPFILDHSTGNMPKSDEVDVPINYADYYFLEALFRLQNQ
ncbi:MAG: glycoside hydrolase family 88 protein [Cyclobacteriaceae bacterium]